MLNDFIFSLNIVAPMAVLVFLGRFLKRLGMITNEFLVGTNKLVFYFAIPSLLFISVYNADVIEIFDPGFIFFITSFVILSFLIIWGATYFILRKKEPEVISALVQGAYRGNVGILAIPLLFNVMGEEAAKGTLALAILIPVFNITAIILLTAHSEKVKGLSIKGLVLGVVKNPPIIGTFAGLAVALSGIRVPAFGETVIIHLAQITTPLALMSLGANMAFREYNPKFKYVLISSVIKLVILPLCAIVSAYFFGFRGSYLTVIMILNGVPSAVVGYVMIVELGGDVYTSATNIALTTLLSSFSLTIFIFSFRVLGIL